MVRYLVLWGVLSFGAMAAADPFVPDDPLFVDQWYVNDDLLPGATNVQGAWNRGITGDGVLIGIVDSGVDYNHPDLSPNFVEQHSVDLLREIRGDLNHDPMPLYDGDNHGTAVAGLAAARGGNGLGITGLAPRAGLAGLRLNWEDLATSEEDLTLHELGLTYHSDAANPAIKVKNHSYGSYNFDDWPAAQRWIDALQSTAKAGTIHVWAAGNSRYYGFGSNTDPRESSPYAIAVAASDKRGYYTYYSSPGPNLFVTAPGSMWTMVTTDRTPPDGYNSTGLYYEEFAGTSAAAPVTTGGIVGLGAQVNPNLDVRLAKHLLVKTARMTDPTDQVEKGWVTNAVGNYFSRNYGFGLIDSDAFTRAAARYTDVTDEATENTGRIAVDREIPVGSGSPVSATFTFSETTPLESVQVSVDLSNDAIFPLSMTLISPSGTRNMLWNPDYKVDRYTDEPVGFMDQWTVLSSAFWGENPAGTWTLELYIPDGGESCRWNSLSVNTMMGQAVEDPNYWTATAYRDLWSKDQPALINAAGRSVSRGDRETYGMYAENVSRVANTAGGGDALSVETAGPHHAFGVYAEGSGSITNDGNVTVRSTDGTSFGLYAEESTSIVNNGTLTVDTQTGGSVGPGRGIYADAVDSITNSNTIDVDTAAGSACGIYGWWVKNSIANSGAVDAYSTTGNATGLSGFWGAQTITNTNQITARADTGKAEGITVNDATAIVNSGTIAANGGQQAVGLRMHESCTLNNSGTITAASSSGKAIGVCVSGQSVRRPAGTPARIVNSGTIEGTEYSILASEETLPDGYLIWPAVETHVTLQTGSNLVGTLQLSSERDTVTLEGSGTEDETFQGIESLIMNGTAWTLSGNSVFESIQNNSGDLTLPGTRTISSALSGTGTLVGDTMTVTGRIAPGNSIGTLTINPSSSADFNGATFELETNDQGNTPGVHNDLTHVTGDANVEASIVKPVAGNAYLEDTPYTFLQVDGTLTVNWADPLEATAEDFTFLDYVTAYDTHNYWFTFSRIPYASVALTPNQTTLGNYLNAVRPSASGDLAGVLGTVDSLGPSQAREAFDQMSGEMYGTLGTVGLQSTTNLLRVLGGQLRPRPYDDRGGRSGHAATTSFAARIGSGDDAPVPVIRGQEPSFRQWTGWTATYGLGGFATADGNAHAIDYLIGGSLVGLQREIEPHTHLGLYYGYAQSNLNLQGLANSANFDSHQWGAFLSRAVDDDYYTLAGSFGHDDFKTFRRIAFGGLDRVARGDHQGWQSSVYVERGRTFRSCCWWLQPYGALQYAYLRQSPFTESGAGSLGFDLDDANLHSLRGLLGARLTRRQALNGLGKPAWDLHALWVHEFLDETAGVANARFAAAGGPSLAVRGLDMGRDFCLLGTGMNWRLNNGFALFAGYDVQFNSQHTFHIGSGGGEFLW